MQTATQQQMIAMIAQPPNGCATPNVCVFGAGTAWAVALSFHDRTPSVWLASARQQFMERQFSTLDAAYNRARTIAEEGFLAADADNTDTPVLVYYYRIGA